MAALANQLPPLVEPPPVVVVVEPRHSSNHSIETLVVVLAAITIIGVIAGIIARLCGGRHFGGSGEHDIEGWVERKCSSCIDGGVTTAPPPAPPPAKVEPKPPATFLNIEDRKRLKKMLLSRCMRSILFMQVELVGTNLSRCN